MKTLGILVLKITLGIIIAKTFGAALLLISLPLEAMFK